MSATTNRAEDLAARLSTTAADLIALIESIDEGAWRHSRDPSVWTISKDADHVADATIYHQWIVRLTIGEVVSSRRPAIERGETTSERSPAEVVARIRQLTDDGTRLILSLTDDQLDLPTRPPRARNARLAETIEAVLIDHHDGHRREIERKLRELGVDG